MSVKLSSDTELDSDFDEHEPTVDEEDDDSIEADEDVADEDEINSLVRESQMSLEDLLASYGMSVTDVPVTTSGSGTPEILTTGLRSLRSAKRPLSINTETLTESIATDSDTAYQTKRGRRLIPVQVPSDDTNRSAPPSPHRQSPSHCFIPNTKSRSMQSFDAVPLLQRISTSTPSPSYACVDSTVTSSASPELVTSRPRSRLRTTSLNFRVDDSTESIVVPRVSTDSTDHRDDNHSSSAHIPEPPSMSSPVMYPDHSTDDHMDVLEESTSHDVSNDDGGEENRRSSDQEEAYSARFWKHAIAVDESPPSYNSDEDEDYAPSLESTHDWRGEIRVGEEYQAQVACSVVVPSTDDLSQSYDSKRWECDSRRLWQPGELPESQVIHFERLFAQTVMFPLPEERTVDDEEALFLLMRCNYDPDEALQRLQFRAIPPSDIPGYMETWSEADSAAFEKGFALYNKDFRQIRDTRLRHKTVGELVHYYYLWKKTARYDEFARVYRRDKRKSPHPSITDFMDYLVLEQEAATAAAVAVNSHPPYPPHETCNTNPSASRYTTSTTNHTNATHHPHCSIGLPEPKTTTTTSTIATGDMDSRCLSREHTPSVVANVGRTTNHTANGCCNTITVPTGVKTTDVALTTPTHLRTTRTSST